MASQAQIVARLRENGIPYGILALQDGVSLVLAERGGRIFGPFLGQDHEAENLTWVNPALADAAAFRAFLDAGEWNLGGDRLWIAPEIQYNVRDRDDFWGTIGVQQQMDPGAWTLTPVGPAAWSLEQQLTLKAYTLATGQKSLHVRRHVRAVDDPLRSLSAYASLRTGVTYAGYEQVVELSERRRDAIMSEAWSLVQLNPGGEVLIPASPAVESTDYFEAVDALHQTRHPTHIRLRITGRRRYKVGYKAAHCFGRLAYVCDLEDGRTYLLIRNFFNNPSAPYVEEPADQVGRRGHSIHVYNDGGMFGGFGELECNGQTIGGETGRSRSVDVFTLWLYVGLRPRIADIALHLLGIEL